MSKASKATDAGCVVAYSGPPGARQATVVVVVVGVVGGVGTGELETWILSAGRTYGNVPGSTTQLHGGR